MHPRLKTIGLPILIGALSAFGFAPFSFPPALIASYAWLFYQLLKQESQKKAFQISYLWALGHYVAGLYWIGNSTLIDFESWWWAYPLASFALPAAFSLYQGVAGYLVVKISKICHSRESGNPLKTQISEGIPGQARDDKNKALKLSLLLLTFPLAELARAYWFSGFPWNMAGVTWISVPWIAQNADYMGMYGLGIITFLCAGALANYKDKKSLVAVCVMLGIMAIYGGVVRQETSFDTTTNVRIVQPNIPQRYKWDNDHIYSNSVTPLAASDIPPAEKKSHNIIIWPETAQASAIWTNPDFNRLYRATFKDWPRGTIIYSGLLNTDPGNMANTITAADTIGRFLWTQNKHHLVPYGEYMPYDDIIKLGPTVGMEGFQKGSAPQTMNDGVIPLICYEIIFPDLARRAVTAYSRMIVTVTDDSWFGISSGPYQHLAMAQFRAIETGLPVLRAANTGISAVIDPYGRIIARTPMEQYELLDSLLPQKRPSNPAYPQWGNLFSAAILLITGLWALFKVSW